LVVKFAPPHLKFFLKLGQVSDISGIIELVLLVDELLLELIVSLLDFINHDFVSGFKLLILVVELAPCLDQLVKLCVQLFQFLHKNI
jgi:hypothetical protein